MNNLCQNIFFSCGPEAMARGILYFLKPSALMVFGRCLIRPHGVYTRAFHKNLLYKNIKRILEILDTSWYTEMSFSATWIFS